VDYPRSDPYVGQAMMSPMGGVMDVFDLSRPRSGVHRVGHRTLYTALYRVTCVVADPGPQPESSHASEDSPSA